MIGGDIEVTVLAVQGEKVRVGVEAPANVPVHRIEIYLEIQRGREEHGEEADVQPGGG
jgi:carbon storage regulator